MQFIPEHMPTEHVKEVVYEERLFDLEVTVDEHSQDRSEIDSFWSNIFYAELDPIDRIRLREFGCTIENYQLYVSDFDSERMTVGVVIASFVRSKDRICYGPVAHTTLTTAGDIISDGPGTSSKSYSRHMTSHVSNLLAVAQQNLEPLDTRYI